MTNPGTSNLVAWYELGEASGTRVDSHGSADFSDVNSCPNAVGVVGNALSPASTTGKYVRRLSDTALDLSGTSFTICGWFYWQTSSVAQYIVSRGITTSNRRSYAVLTLSSNVLRFSVSAGSTWSYVDHGTTLSTSSWYFFYAIHDDGANILKVGLGSVGTEATTFFSGTLYAGSNDNGIGAWGNNGTAVFDGRIDQLAFFNDILTPTELSWMENSGSGRAYSDLAGGGVSIPVVMATYRRRRSGLWAP